MAIVVLETTRDLLWLDEGNRRGWSLGPPAPLWRRLWGIRHIRALGLLIDDRYTDWCWAQVGMMASGYKDWCRYAVLRGWV